MISLSLSIRLCDSLVGSIFRTKSLDNHASFFGVDVDIALKIHFIVSALAETSSMLLRFLPNASCEPSVEFVETVGHGPVNCTGFCYFRKFGDI